MNIFKKILVYSCIIFFVLFVVIFLDWKSQDLKKFDISDVKETDIAIVFGAGLKADGIPSDILADRIKVAVDLYKNNKVKKILMSGDNSTIYHNEIYAMKKYAINLSVPEEAVVEGKFDEGLDVRRDRVGDAGHVGGRVQDALRQFLAVDVFLEQLALDHVPG